MARNSRRCATSEGLPLGWVLEIAAFGAADGPEEDEASGNSLLAGVGVAMGASSEGGVASNLRLIIGRETTRLGELFS